MLDIFEITPKTYHKKQQYESKAHTISHRRLEFRGDDFTDI